MKNFISLSVLFFCFGVWAQAPQETISLQMDPNTQCQIRYNYFPNLEAYFDMSKNIYIFYDKGEWITASEIPAGYRGYSLYNKLNVPINDYDDDNITQFIKVHRKKYPYNNGRKMKEMTASVN